MASTERSLGWATSGTGDGPAAGYDSSRWRANAQKSDGTGITLYGSYMAMSGATTSTLTIADGAAIINGYTYETNGSVTISTSGLTGTYSVVLVANNTAGTVTVTANGAGTTTVGASTIRVAIATAAQVTTITTAVGAANVITLGTVVVAAGVISSIASLYPYATTLTLATSIYAYMTLSSVTTIGTSSTTVTGYGTTATSGHNALVADGTSGVITNNGPAGMYSVTAYCYWDANTTGQRLINVRTTGTAVGNLMITQTNAASSFSYNPRMSVSGLLYLSNSATVYLELAQNSGSSRTISEAYLALALV